MKNFTKFFLVMLTGTLVSSVASATQAGRAGFGAGLDLPLMAYQENVGTAAIGRDFFSLGIRMNGEYGITDMIAAGIEIIPTFEFKAYQDFDSMPIIFYGKTHAGMGYGKVGISIDYLNGANDIDVGVNLGFGITLLPSDVFNLEIGIEITPYFRYDLRLPIALRIGAVFSP